MLVELTRQFSLEVFDTLGHSAEDADQSAHGQAQCFLDPNGLL